MSIEIFVERDSSSKDIDRAFQAIAFGYRTVVVDYVRRQGTSSVAELAEEADVNIQRLLKDLLILEKLQRPVWTWIV